MSKYLVVSGNQHFEFADGDFTFNDNAYLIRGGTDNVEEALRMLAYGATRRPESRIVRVSVNFEEVSPDELHDARRKKARKIFNGLTKQDQELLNEFVTWKPAPAKMERQYIVDSFTEPGTEYTVEKLTDQTWTCTCPAYTFSKTDHKDCKHIHKAQGAVVGHRTGRMITQGIRRLHP